MLELSGQEFKTTMINTLRTLLNRQYIRTDKQCKQKDENIKKELKRNARDQKHCNRNEECLWWSH